ncbi:hypothetical protein [Nonomuraea sp. NPDC049709]|uniref:hypothetical protein n=1 Tax=Nonomuraea sp. NPDC049709 TaxID=3154736 RepID=UPI0034295CE9
MLEGKLDALSQMMAEHRAMKFPPGFRGLDIGDRDMVTLDAYTYGCAANVLKGPLNEQHRSLLTRLKSVTEEVLPQIDDEYATEYYTHVRDMAVLAAEIESLRQK